MSGEIIGVWVLNTTWNQYKDDFFKYAERKRKEGAKRYALVGKIHDAWMKLDWNYAQKEYISYIEEFHSQFHVFGMGEQNLEELSTDVFVLEKPEFRKHDQSEKTTKIGGLKLVSQDKRGEKLFIWGEPGAGKTTFLKQILSYAIKKSVKTPLFVNIAEWSATFSMTKEGLYGYLAEQFERCGFSDATIFIEYIIEKGYAILLFDGLDEISYEQRKSVTRLLEQHKKSKSQIIVTCRVDAIRSRLDGYWQVQVAKWDERRVQNFIRKRFLNSKLQKRFIDELNDDNNKGLKDFKKNPLLLSLLCSFNPKRGFPKKRSDIYFEATRHLLIERDQEKTSPVSREAILEKLTLVQKESLYAHLAYNSFSKEQLYFTQQELEQEISTSLANILCIENPHEINSSLILPKLISQHGILSRRGHRTYAFSHLTFQEYYTAKYIVDNHKLRDLAKQINDDHWREIFFLTAGLLPDATELFQTLQITAQSIIIDNPKVLALQKWAKKRATYTSHYKKNAKRALYWYIFLSFGVELVRYCAHEAQFQSCLEFISDFTNPFVATLDKLLDLSLELDSDINDIYKIGYFDADANLASRMAHDLNAHVDTLEASYIPSLSLFLNYITRFPVTQFDLANTTSIPVSKNIIFDFLTSQLVLIVNSWDDFKDSKEFKKGLQIFYNIWKKTQTSPLDRKNIPDFHSETNIQKFKTSIYKFTEDFFDISLDKITNLESNESWDAHDLNIVLNYLDINLLIRDCLQTADVKNHEAVQDMILNMPKTTLEIRSYLPHKKKPVVIPF